MQKIQSLFRMSLAICFAATLCITASADDKLVIGSQAPELDIEYWLSDNDGLYGHIQNFEEGTVYVVSFWSSNNGPSLGQMSNVAALQKKYDEKVQFIYISIEELEKIQDFLDRPVVRGKDQTYGEFTNGFCLTADPDRSVFEDYQLASGLKAIPTAFVVGKTGLIEWMGSLAMADTPIKQIVDDQWDREEYKKKAEEVAKEEAERVEVMKKLSVILPPIIRRARLGENEEALELLTEAIPKEEGRVKDQLLTIKLQILIQENHEELAEGLQEFIDIKKKYEWEGEINDLVWSIYERHVARDDINEKVLKIALEGAKLAAAAEPENGAILDTYAHLIYVVEKDLDKAIEYQKKAIVFADGREADLKPFLDDLLEEKKTGKKPSKSKSKKKPKVEESDF